jgi:hypothetical protein
MNRILKYVAIAVAVLVAVLLGVLYYPFDSPGLGRAISDAVAKATGAQLQASGFRLQIARGLTLSDLKLSTETPGARISLQMDELALNHRLWPLLRGEVEVRQIVLDGPTVELTSKPAPAQPASTPAPPPAPEAPPPPSATPAPPPAQSGASAPGGRPMRLAVERFAILNGRVTLRTEGDANPKADLTGLALELGDIVIDPSASPAFMGLAGAGELTIDSIAWAEGSFTDVQGAMAVRQGRAELKGVGLRSALGSAVLDQAVVDLTTSPFRYQFSAGAKDLDVNAAIGATGQRALGPASLTLTGEGRGPDLEAFHGQGRLSLAAGALPDLPALKKLDSSLETGIVGARYEATDVNVEVTEGRLTLVPFTLRSDLLTLDLSGNGDVTGRLDVDGDLRVPTKFHGEVLVQPIALRRTSSSVGYQVGVAAKTIDVNRLIGRGASGLGPASFTASAKGDSPRPEDLRADGTLQLTPGKLPGIKPLALLDKVLGTSVVGTPYQATAVKFALAGDRVTLQPFTLTSGGLRLGVGGSVDASGPIALKVSVAVRRADMKPDREFSQQALDALTDKAGWLSFPVTVSGTLDDPSMAPDMDAIKQTVARAAKAAVKGGVEKVERAVADQLGGLIRKRTGR